MTWFASFTTNQHCTIVSMRDSSCDGRSAMTSVPGGRSASHFHKCPGEPVQAYESVTIWDRIAAAVEISRSRWSQLTPSCGPPVAIRLPVRPCINVPSGMIGAKAAVELCFVYVFVLLSTQRKMLCRWIMCTLADTSWDYTSSCNLNSKWMRNDDEAPASHGSAFTAASSARSTLPRGVCAGNTAVQ